MSPLAPTLYNLRRFSLEETPTRVRAHFARFSVPRDALDPLCKSVCELLRMVDLCTRHHLNPPNLRNACEDYDQLLRQTTYRAHFFRDRVSSIQRNLRSAASHVHSYLRDRRQQEVNHIAEFITLRSTIYDALKDVKDSEAPSNSETKDPTPPSIPKPDRARTAHPNLLFNKIALLSFTDARTQLVADEYVRLHHRPSYVPGLSVRELAHAIFHIESKVLLTYPAWTEALLPLVSPKVRDRFKPKAQALFSIDHIFKVDPAVAEVLFKPFEKIAPAFRDRILSLILTIVQMLRAPNHEMRTYALLQFLISSGIFSNASAWMI
jgi:hypothetical protein